ncbi:MAG: lipid-A-disaccharide synthase [Flavobacteriales bacterium]|jgi:lipid-A-disaccharide synthase|nr:lipid-A-disaccharide synthase [Flavobacteriales bacterium]
MVQTRKSKSSIQRVFMIAGEASGDAYGGMLVRELLNAQPTLEIHCWGGDAMEKAGATCHRHYRTLAFMGIWEVVKNALTIRHRFRECWNQIEAFQPDVLVGIDYPGFNLRMARRAKRAGITTHHYISPSVWAWKKNRVKTIQRDIDRLHVILPFEKEWYAKAGMDVAWVGHPLLELLKNESQPHATKGQKPRMLLLPGSRAQELEYMLPIMVETAKSLTQFEAVIAGAPGRTKTDYRLAEEAGIPVEFGRTRALMRSCDVGLVTSGTATLEAALLGLPHVICYKTSRITYALARILVKSHWIGLPNILLNKNAVQEQIQAQCTPNALRSAVLALHDGQALGSSAKQQLQQFQQLGRALQSDRPASEQVAASILAGK